MHHDTIAKFRLRLLNAYDWAWHFEWLATRNNGRSHGVNCHEWLPNEIAVHRVGVCTYVCVSSYPSYGSNRTHTTYTLFCWLVGPADESSHYHPWKIIPHVWLCLLWV